MDTLGHQGYAFPSVPPVMTAAITNGSIDKIVSPSNVSGNCPTGNCTWGRYQSIGVCSNVADASSTITSHCRDSITQLYPGGCNYSVRTIDRYPTMLGTNLTNADTLWIGASMVPFDWVFFQDSTRPCNFTSSTPQIFVHGSQTTLLPITPPNWSL